MFQHIQYHKLFKLYFQTKSWNTKIHHIVMKKKRIKVGKKPVKFLISHCHISTHSFYHRTNLLMYISFKKIATNNINCSSQLQLTKSIKPHDI